MPDQVIESRSGSELNIEENWRAGELVPYFPLYVNLFLANRGDLSVSGDISQLGREPPPPPPPPAPPPPPPPPPASGAGAPKGVPRVDYVNIRPSDFNALSLCLLSGRGD